MDSLSTPASFSAWRNSSVTPNGMWTVMGSSSPALKNFFVMPSAVSGIGLAACVWMRTTIASQR